MIIDRHETKHLIISREYNFEEETYFWTLTLDVVEGHTIKIDASFYDIEVHDFGILIKEKDD